MDFLGDPDHCDPGGSSGDHELAVGRTANEAMLSQIEASNQWNYYQAKSIKAAVLDSKIAFTGASDESDQSKRARYKQEQQEIDRRPSTNKPRQNYIFTSTKCLPAA
jgi:Domain of unknown function (DUF4337)